MRLLQGIIYATIGALVGALPAFLSYQFGWYIGYLYALVPFVAAFAYNRSRGPRSQIAVIIIAILSIIVPTGYILLYYSRMASQTYGLGLFDYISHYGEYVLDSMIEDVIVSLIFSGLGLFIAWRYIMNKTVYDY